MRRMLPLILLLIALAVPSLAQVTPAPSLMNFQGRLTRPDGTPVSDGNYSIRFSLWSALTGGTEKWNQTVSPLAVHKGAFAAVLNVSSAATLFDGDLYLEIKIGTDTPLTPRQRLVSVAYAMKANSVPDNSITSAKIVDGTITGADIANGTITGVDIASATITADKLASGTLNATAWLLGGNSGIAPASNFLGTTDAQPLILRTNNVERMRIGADGFVGIGRTGRLTGQEVFGIQSPNTVGFGGMYMRNSGENTLPFYGYSRNGAIDGYHFVDQNGTWTLVTGLDQNLALRIWRAGDSNFNGMNIVSGHYNSVGTGVYGATVFGGDYYGGAEPNKVLSHGGTVSGGASNTAGGPDAMSNRYATVGGGIGNTASGVSATISGGVSNVAGPNWYAFVGGGYSNQATGFWSVIPGGSFNEATGYYSFAAGQNAKARHNGTFVWANGNTDFSGTDFASTASNQFLVRAPGGVGIGTNAPTAQLDVNGNIRSRGGDFILNGRGGGLGNSGGAGRALVDAGTGAGIGVYGLILNFANDYGQVYVDSKMSVNGNVYASGGFTSSDRRLKEHITPLAGALDSILNLRGVTFDWKHEPNSRRNLPDGKQIGFIAQEVEQILPELVTTDPTGYKAVAYQNIVPVLVEAVKTLNTRVESKQKQIEALQQENEAKERRLSTIEADNRALKERLEAIEKALSLQK